MSSQAVRAAWAEGWPKIVAYQKSLASSSAFIHRKDGDLLTSKIIPLAMSAVGTAAIVPGLYNMYFGKGKIE